MIAALKDTATIFMSTHILADVERICDQVGIIDHGRLITAGKRSELLARYHTDAILIELEPGHEQALSTWLKGLKAAWLSHLTMEGATARIQVKDIDLARKELLGSLGKLKAARPEIRGIHPGAGGCLPAVGECQRRWQMNLLIFPPQGIIGSLAQQAFPGGHYPVGILRDDVTSAGEIHARNLLRRPGS